MVHSVASDRIDEIRASILAQVIQREYLEQMVEKTKSRELAFGSDYPHGISKWLQDLIRKVAHTKKLYVV